MLLSEMLTHTASEFLDDRADLVDGENDDLWSDAYLVRQFNQAEKILCRRAWAIIEYGKAPAGIFVLATDKVLYDLHPSILRVFDATPSTQTLPLGRSDDILLRDNSLLNRGVDSDFTAYDVGELAALLGTSSYTGAPLAIATDAGTHQARVSPIPTSTQNGVVVALKIARLPINELTLDDTDASPEVDEQWHLALCEYAAGKALTLPTADSDQKVEGRRLLAEFAETVRLARQERVRAEMGSGRWGFSSSTAVCGR